MLLLLSHDIMITPYLLRITPYHAICCALPSLTAECCAWLTHIHYMNTYMPSMPFISHTHRYMDKQSIRINTASLQFREGKSRMVQRQQQNMGEPSEREHYSLYCWIYLQGSA
jgi:hypothetical protein